MLNCIVHVCGLCVLIDSDILGQVRSGAFAVLVCNGEKSRPCSKSLPVVTGNYYYLEKYFSFQREDFIVEFDSDGLPW